MRFMTTWSFPTGNIPEAAERFLAGVAQPPQGMKLLGRWHNADCSGGYALYEANDAAVIYEDALKWADLLELSCVAVIDDEQAGAALAKRFKK